MKSIGVFDAKTRLSELITRVAAGESFRITKHGRSVARIVPDTGTDARRIAAAAERLRSFRGLLADLDSDQLREDRQAGRRF